MRELKQRFYIISAHRFSETGEENHNRAAGLYSALVQLGFDFKPVNGFWEGQREASFLVLDKGPEWRSEDDQDTFECIQGLAEVFDQDSFLERHPDNSVELHYTRYVAGAGYSEHIGQWREDDPRDGEAYTQDPATGRTYVAR